MKVILSLNPNIKEIITCIITIHLLVISYIILIFLVDAIKINSPKHK